MEMSLPDLGAARVSSRMELQPLPNQRAVGSSPAGSKELIKLETKKCARKFLEIRCPGHAGGSEVVVLSYGDEVFPTSRRVPPCLSQLQLDQEGIPPKRGLPSSVW